MVEQLKKLTNPDSLVSLFLGIAVVLVIGVLIVNYVRGRQSFMTKQTSSQSEETSGMTGSTKLPATHTVADGETLWSIASSTIGSGYNWVDIAKANNLTNADVIYAGQKLTVPNVPKIMPAENVSSAAVEVQKPAGGKYMVQKGDSLWSISMHIYGTGYRWSEIATLNKLANPDLIFSGSDLQLP